VTGTAAAFAAEVLLEPEKTFEQEIDDIVREMRHDMKQVRKQQELRGMDLSHLLFRGK
jgi:hypothetical protein